MSSGATLPALFECRDSEGRYSEYVVKFANQLAGSVLCEVYASILARMLGLMVPDPAVVHLPFSLLAHITDRRIAEIATPGSHFGTRYLVGSQPHGAGQPISGEQLSSAFRVFAFDMLIQNTDRVGHVGYGNVNLLSWRDQFYLIDHEKAFSFLHLIGPPPDPFVLRGQPYVRDHLFYAHLRQRPDLPFGEFTNALHSLPCRDLAAVCDALPSELQRNGNADRIYNHIRTLCGNASRFEASLREALA